MVLLIIMAISSHMIIMSNIWYPNINHRHRREILEGVEHTIDILKI